MFIPVPRRHRAQKWKKLLESHLSVTWEGCGDGRQYQDEGKVMEDGGCSFQQVPGQLLSSNATQSSKNTVEHSRHRWHHWSIVRLRFCDLWIFMMLIHWVAIGARTANKLCPPCLKGNALPILKTLCCSTGRRRRATLQPCKAPGFRMGKQRRIPFSIHAISVIHCEHFAQLKNED